MRNTRSLLVTIVVVGIVAALVALTIAQHYAATPTGSALGGQYGPSPAYDSQYGQVSATLTSPDGVNYRIVAIERGATRWLFHIHAQNVSGKPATILGQEHYFMLSGQGTPGTPVTASQIFLKLVSPEQTGLSGAALVSRPALPTLVSGTSAGDGWLAADLTHFKYPPNALLYVYGTVTTPACSNPQDQSTCHPDTGYRTLTWLLP